VVLVWKNIRERLQKYDTDMTKAKPLKKKYLSLSGLGFSPSILKQSRILLNL
jgi:hypothetical protein